MSLEQKLNDAIKTAMKAKDRDKLTALRAVKSEVMLANTSKGAGDMTEDAEIKMLQKLVKQRKDSAAIYTEQDRADLAEEDLKQIEYIQAFLPAQLSEEEVNKVVTEVIAQTGAESMKDMGKVMGIVSGKLAGQAEGKLISQLVKAALA
jgi:uncharacterized protein YqeY